MADPDRCHHHRAAARSDGRLVDTLEDFSQWIQSPKKTLVVVRKSNVAVDHHKGAI